MSTVRMMIAQPQFASATCVWMNCSARKRYLPIRPQKPNSSSGSSVILVSVAWIALQHVDRLRSNEDARLGVAAGIAQRRAEDRHFNRALGGGEPAPKPVRLIVFATSSLAVQRGHRAVAGESGRKTAAKKDR